MGLCPTRKQLDCMGHSLLSSFMLFLWTFSLVQGHNGGEGTQGTRSVGGAKMSSILTSTQPPRESLSLLSALSLMPGMEIP